MTLGFSNKLLFKRLNLLALQPIKKLCSPNSFSNLESNWRNKEHVYVKINNKCKQKLNIKKEVQLTLNQRGTSGQPQKLALSTLQVLSKNNLAWKSWAFTTQHTSSKHIQSRRHALTFSSPEINAIRTFRHWRHCTQAWLLVRLAQQWHHSLKEFTAWCVHVLRMTTGPKIAHTE